VAEMSQHSSLETCRMFECLEYVSHWCTEMDASLLDDYWTQPNSQLHDYDTIHEIETLASSHERPRIAQSSFFVNF
jgi:hypothetical protein